MERVDLNALAKNSCDTFAIIFSRLRAKLRRAMGEADPPKGSARRRTRVRRGRPLRRIAIFFSHLRVKLRPSKGEADLPKWNGRRSDSSTRYCPFHSGSSITGNSETMAEAVESDAAAALGEASVLPSE